MTNQQQDKRIKELELLLIEHGIIETSKENKALSFSEIKLDDLKQLVDIKQNFNNDIFNNWFDFDVDISSDMEFLNSLFKEYRFLASSFNEDTLKVKFIGMILNRIKFVDLELEINDFYHKNLSYKNENINFNGFCDFYVAKGLKTPEKPYFFIQEYKPSIGGTNPEPQLLAELISAIELNCWKSIKGAYIVGAIWNFVILEKIGKNRYQYFISKNFDSSDINGLKFIYKNLLFIKNEIVEMIGKEA